MLFNSWKMTMIFWCQSRQETSDTVSDTNFERLCANWNYLNDVNRYRFVGDSSRKVAGKNWFFPTHYSYEFYHQSMERNVDGSAWRNEMPDRCSYLRKWICIIIKIHYVISSLCVFLHSIDAPLSRLSSDFRDRTCLIMKSLGCITTY